MLGSRATDGSAIDLAVLPKMGLLKRDGIQVCRPPCGKT